MASRRPIEVAVYRWPDGSTLSRILDMRQFHSIVDTLMIEGKRDTPHQRRWPHDLPIEIHGNWGTRTGSLGHVLGSGDKSIYSNFVLRDVNGSPLALLSFESNQIGGRRSPEASLVGLVLNHGGRVSDEDALIRGMLLDVLVHYFYPRTGTVDDPAFLVKMPKSWHLGLPVPLFDDHWAPFTAQEQRPPAPADLHAESPLHAVTAYLIHAQDLVKAFTEVLKQSGPFHCWFTPELEHGALAHGCPDLFRARLQSHRVGRPPYPLHNHGGPLVWSNMRFTGQLLPSPVAVVLRFDPAPPNGRGAWSLYHYQYSPTKCLLHRLAESDTLRGVLHDAGMVTTFDQYWDTLDAAIIEGAPLLDIGVYHELHSFPPVWQTESDFCAVAGALDLPQRWTTEL